MKTLILSFVLTLIFGGVAAAQAQTGQTVRVRVGQQQRHPASKLKIQFVSLVEDSRCPAGTNCVWAGNAAIQVKITDAAGKSETFELNTNTGARGASFGRYTINLVSLTPVPRENIRINRNGYTATFRVGRLTR